MKKVLNICVLLIALVILLPFNVFAASREVIDTEVTVENNKITVTGNVDPGVYAVAILVYNDDELVDMESCSSDETFSCELSKTFVPGTYTVKTANYNGGPYVTDEVTVVDAPEETNDDTNQDDNPKTYDNIIKSVAIGGVSAITLAGLVIYLKKKKRTN